MYTRRIKVYIYFLTDEFTLLLAKANNFVKLIRAIVFVSDIQPIFSKRQFTKGLCLEGQPRSDVLSKEFVSL